MRQHLGDPKLDLKEVGRHLGFSRSHFCRFFSRSSGEGFSRYLMKMRTEEAKRLLETTRLSVAEMAERCGFTSPKYFSSVFRRMEGVTPSQYRHLGETGVKYREID